MRRREFITLLGGVAAWPLAARAQQGERMRRIGVLRGVAANDPLQQAMTSAFVEALADLGWREGRNIRIEYRMAAGDANLVQAQAAELAGLAPDIIFVQGTPPTTAVRRAAPTTPIVFVNVTDPVASGLVSSLAHPGGNITGFTNFELTMGGKWLETLKQVAPAVNRAAVLMNPDNPANAGQLRSIETAAPRLGIQVSAAPVRNAADAERSIEAFAAGANGGLLILTTDITNTHREAIIALAAKHRLPAVYTYRYFAATGGLVSYGPDEIDEFRRAAGYVDRILRGEKPADLPVQAPTKFELVINLKTAKALDLTIPPNLLATADEVIE
jgi:putative tryptophan/tyrosine transport system substrate-binding protein